VETLTKNTVIAVVDDDEALREALASVLKAAGFFARTFPTAEEFLACENGDQTTCLVLDVRLPGMSGVELQKRLTETGNLTPIIFVTAHGDASLRDSLTRAGAAGFLYKPVRSEALLNEIRKALASTIA
jgi:two-component system, LuxR family, response regulator FixJ